MPDGRETEGWRNPQARGLQGRMSEGPLSSLRSVPPDPSGPRSPRQREPSRLLANPRGQVHTKLPPVLVQSPPEQRPGTLRHSSTSV